MVSVPNAYQCQKWIFKNVSTDIPQITRAKLLHHSYILASQECQIDRQVYSYCQTESNLKASTPPAPCGCDPHAAWEAL